MKALFTAGIAWGPARQASVATEKGVSPRNEKHVFRAWSCMNFGMATKTITLEPDAYERLKRAKGSPRESFSEVVRRFLPLPAEAITAAGLLALTAERGAMLNEADARAIDELKSL